jgi:ribosomal protein S6--L-glutamate ligase
MILSYHPMYVGDENGLCAGRDPDADDRAAMARAAAVILPQGCRESLYRMAREACPRVFPDYAVRFRYPGKTGQIRLFRERGIPHPETVAYASAADFRGRGSGVPGGFPAVFKLDGGGEGESVWRVDDPRALEKALGRAEIAEHAGQPGFLLQRYVPSGRRTLRVAAIGDIFRSYWRIQDDPAAFAAGLAEGARLDRDADPALQRRGREAARDFCDRTGVDLAGFDLLFEDGNPLFLEINHFFGRRGLGGSDAYYRLLIAAIDRWLIRRGMTPPLQRDGDFPPEIADDPRPRNVFP